LPAPTPKPDGAEIKQARPDRRELHKMLGRLIHGDVVMLTRIDRLNFAHWPNRGPIPAPAPGA